MQRKISWPDLRGLTLVVGTIAWLAGIILDAWVLLPSLALLVGSIVALLCVIVFWRNSRGRLVALIAFCLLLGAWRYATVSPAGDHTAISAWIGTKKLEVIGSVVDEPKLQARSSLLTIAVSSVSTNNGVTWQGAHGEMEALIPGSNIDDPYGAHYGDTVDLQGNLQAPQPHSVPSIFAGMIFPRLTISQSGGNPLIAALYSLRTTLATIIERTLPQPMAALLIALVLSLRTPALKSLIPAFNATGTAHLIAPSGFKVTILAGLIDGATQRLSKRHGKRFQRLLPAEKRKGNWQRMLATGLVIVSITGYTFLSGGGPAAIRAGIMGIVLAIAPRFGRVYNVYSALALSALLMSVFDPFVLWDAGFQLSLLGTLGIVMLTPRITRLFHLLDRVPLGQHLAEIIAVTLAAETATLPIFALTFQQVSLIAPITNLLTVPLLAVMIVLGLFVCGTGVIALPLGIFCGWAAWPLLWYIIAAVKWCATLPLAFFTVNNLNIDVAWCYYALLALIVSTMSLRWPQQQHSGLLKATPPPLVSRRVRRLIQLGAILIIILATGTAALAARSNGQLTITFLNVGPANQPPQGEAILVRTSDGKTALIDGGLDASSLAAELDARLPFWQRSLDMVILTAPRQDDLVGLQDIVTRYQVGEVVDAGVLHPNTGYALFRRTINERNIPYIQARQGATIALGTQVAIQVFWPTSPLHKGSTEELDNGLILRLLAPGLRLLLVGETALSKYALSGLLTTIDKSYLQANVVQLVAEVGKTFPTALPELLQLVHPSTVVITPATLPPKLRKAGATSVLTATSLQPINGPWQIEQTAQIGTLELSSNGNGWAMNAGA